jgi:hypothetical protein
MIALLAVLSLVATSQPSTERGLTSATRSGPAAAETRLPRFAALGADYVGVPGGVAGLKVAQRTATVCVAREARQCWSEPGTTGCRANVAAGGRVFRVVIDDPGRVGVRSALAHCQAAVSR